MANKKIRVAAKSAEVPLWRPAEEFGWSEATMTRRLHHEWDAEATSRALKIIDELRKEV